MAIFNNKESKQYAVIGLGRFGTEVARTLYKMGKEVLAIDIDEDKVNAVADFTTHSIIADASDEHVLDELGISHFDVVVIGTAENMQSSVLITMLCKEKGVPYVVAKAKSLKHRKVLEKVGADQVVLPESEIGHKVGMMLSSPRLCDMMELTEGFVLAEIAIPSRWSGKTLQEIDIRKKTGVSVLVIKRDSEVIINPVGGTRLQLRDFLVIGGEVEMVKKFSEQSNK